MADKDRNITPYYGIFNDSFPPILDGVTLTVENYVRWLRAKGNEACVITPWNPVRGDYPYKVLRYFSLPIRSRKPYRYGYPKLDPLIWSKLRNTPFKLVHAHCPFSSGRLAVYAKKHQNVPLIGTFHSKYESDLKHSFKRTPWMVPIIMKRVLDFFNACDQVWIPQASVSETVREYGYKGDLEVVDNGIDYVDKFHENLQEFKRESRERNRIPPQSLSLLFVGQHIWEKGIGIIADALNLIKERIDFTMVFVGSGYAERDLKDKLRTAGLLDRVRLQGVISDRKELSRYYGAADLFLFPSFYDNAPLVVREAAALGTPSIIPIGSTASEVIKDGQNGFLVERTAESYAEILCKLAADKERIRTVGENASASLVRSWEDVVEEVIDRYETLVKQHNRKCK